jgi:IPT/TIG domain
MIITSARIKGDKQVQLLGDDAKRYHFISKEAATGWTRSNSVVPTLASISPATIAAAPTGTVTIVLTGTAFTAGNEITVNGSVFPVKTFTNATTMSVTINKSTVPTKYEIGVLVNGYLPVLSPRTFTFT